MVAALGPGRFYGSGLPRPWFHPDVKFAEERVDPPPPVLDPLLRWAQEAHWSMGGLSFQRHRLQGRIEGSIKKIRAEAERAVRSSGRSEKKTSMELKKKHPKEGEERSRKRRLSLLSECDDDAEVKEHGLDGDEVKETEEARVVATTERFRRLRQRQRRLAILEEDASVSDHDEKAAKQGAASAPLSPERPRRKSARRLGIEFDRIAASSSPQDGKSQRI